MANFFIDRPIFAWVIAIMIMLAGGISLYSLPIAQYPDIAMPEISVQTRYPGASAQTAEDSVTQIIEQNMKGLDNLLYMYSNSDSTGASSINLVFQTGTNVDIAQVQVQNKLQLATPMLPEEVQRQGIRVSKSVKNFLLVIGFISDGSMDNTDISDYVAANIQDPVSRLEGVGETQLFGAQYAMRIWCDPEKFHKFSLNPSDVIMAIQAQNAQIPGGQIGAAPALPGQEINITVNASSRLESVEEFENIILRTNQDGSILRLKDVARIELNGESFMAFSRFNGEPSSGLAVKLAAGANALDTADVIKAKIEEMSPFFPKGLKVVYPWDTTPFVKLSIESVFHTLGEAIVLVFLVMLLFLQNLRATLIPTIAIPVVLLGTFGVLAALGFSINSLTMFGMVLAIGLLVDDAIVVVENVERLMREEKLSPKEAAKKSMRQITGALVGVAMVICAVLIPMAFIGGSTGVIYRQFSVTIVTAMLLSVVVAIVLTPAMCATMLPQHAKDIQTGFFGRFNRWFDGLTDRYQIRVGKILTRPKRYMLAFSVAVAVMVFMFLRLPSAFLPEEDQGIILASVQLDSGATFERTQEVLDKVDRYFREEEGDAVESVLTVAGFSFGGAAQNAGLAFIRLKDWDLRHDSDLKVPAVVQRAMRHFSSIPEARVFAFAPPAVPELGFANGFDFELVDRAGRGHDELMAARDQLLASARAHPDLRNVRHNGLDDVAQYKLIFDLEKASAQGLDKSEINTAIAAYWGSVYINDFMDRGRTKKVYLQADSKFRMQPSDFNRYYVRNRHGQMVPFSSFLSVDDKASGSPRLERYNGVSSIEIMGDAAPGMSSGQAMLVMEELAKDLPAGFGFEWTGLSFQEKMVGDQAMFLYALSIIVVFLCLAALYESWTSPLSVLLVVPLGVIGALVGVTLRGMNNDVYFQVGLLTVVGLSAKNSILIVEFAKEIHKQGMELLAATMEAVKLRLRPIIMTSLAFILGVVPLAISDGAGSGGQNAIGTAVCFGMVAATALGIYYTPIFFVIVTRFFSGESRGKAKEYLKKLRNKLRPPKENDKYEA
ncbi:MAG: efflux RND transporter permease subunit [Desulfovibrionaceae bacterium]|nr:efflux RND transporter permease subunit [Desulfovibrionaceae bacterium]